MKKDKKLVFLDNVIDDINKSIKDLEIMRDKLDLIKAGVIGIRNKIREEW